MKKLTVAISIALAALVLGATSVSASKMNGKCCQSSDGGRSYRYRVATQRAALPRTCSAYASSCIRHSTAQPDRVQMCEAAKAQCLQTGVHIGPYSGWQFAGLQKR